MGRISSALPRSLGDRIRVVVASVLLLFAWGSLAVAPFSRVRTLLVRFGNAGSAVVVGNPTPARIAATVDVADRFLPGDRTCLVRSMAAETLLRLHAVTPEHRIGVAKQPDGSMKAHSWLEFEDDVLIGDLDDLSQYEPLPPLDRGDER